MEASLQGDRAQRWGWGLPVSLTITPSPALKYCTPPSEPQVSAWTLVCAQPWDQTARALKSLCFELLGWRPLLLLLPPPSREGA